MFLRCRRERTSKMKYQEPENEISRRRRRDKSSSQTPAPLSLIQNQQPTTSVVASISTKPATQTIHSSLIGSGKARNSLSDSNTNQPDSPTRRLSSPFVTHGAGVLTASLQLPVHVQMQDVKSTLNLAGDLADIPFIEDGGYGGDVGTDMSGKTILLLRNHISIAIKFYFRSSNETRQHWTHTTTYS